MAHFAKLDNNNVVIEVNVVNNNVLDSQNEELSGIAFLTNWSNGHSNWKQTSFNGTICKNFAGIGFSYDPDLDAFIPPKPFDSWILNQQVCQWEPPVIYPTDGEIYNWNENNLSWDLYVSS